MSIPNDEERKCLTKADLAKALCAVAELELDKDRCVSVVEDYIELIKIGLEEDGKVLLTSFGAFEVREKAVRRGINPKTLEPMMLRPRRVVRFKPSPKLRKVLNS